MTLPVRLSALMLGLDFYLDFPSGALAERVNVTSRLFSGQLPVLVDR